jgi:hypothetical protein
MVVEAGNRFVLGRKGCNGSWDKYGSLGQQRKVVIVASGSSA